MSGENQDSAFFQSFKGGMDYLHLPCPETLYGSVTTATGSLLAMANYVKSMGTKVTLRELIFAFPTLGGGASAVAVAGASVEILGTIAAGAAAFYIGYTVGCLIAAALDVYGGAAIAKLSGWLFDMRAELGPIDQLILRAPGLALTEPMRKSLDVIRAVGGSTQHPRRTAYA
jgi:hypothetical protein